MSVRGMGRRSARPPYNILWATLAAAETIWSGLGIRSMHRSYQPVRSPRQRSRRVSYVEALRHPLAGASRGPPDLLLRVVEQVDERVADTLRHISATRQASSRSRSRTTGAQASSQT